MLVVMLILHGLDCNGADVWFYGIFVSIFGIFCFK